jgi:hypothetical protein
MRNFVSLPPWVPHIIGFASVLYSGRQNHPPVSWKAAFLIGCHATFTALLRGYSDLYGIRHLVLRPEDKTEIRNFISLPP